MIPEVVLHKALVDGIRNVRADARVIDSMFRDLPQDTLQALKDVVLKQKLQLSINYPRADTLKLPMISIILKTEAEAQPFLGDVMGVGQRYDLPDAELSYELLGGGLPSALSGLPKPLTSALPIEAYSFDTALGKTTVTVHDPSGEVALLGPIPDSYFWIAEGAGSGEKLRVVSISGNTVKLSGVFEATLDLSSRGKIRPVKDFDASTVGEPSRVYDEDNKHLIRKGANYDVQYQLSIIAGHQDEVLYLYSIIKAILFSQKKFMESQGIMALKISGTDFAPRSDFLPAEAFQRVMTLQFVYPFSFIEEMPIYDKISVAMDAGDGSTCGITSFDISL